MATSRNPAEVRGDIQSGRTEDKRPGFDPAAAPLETDSEAGASALSPEQTAMATEGRAGKPGSPEPVSYNDAMRRRRGTARTEGAGGPLTAYLAIVVVMIVVIAAVAGIAFG